MAFSYSLWSIIWLSDQLFDAVQSELLTASLNELQGDCEWYFWKDMKWNDHDQFWSTFLITA
jgi:hypothetical protein